MSFKDFFSTITVLKVEATPDNRTATLWSLMNVLIIWMDTDYGLWTSSNMRMDCLKLESKSINFDRNINISKMIQMPWNIILYKNHLESFSFIVTQFSNTFKPGCYLPSRRGALFTGNILISPEIIIKPPFISSLMEKKVL